MISEELMPQFISAIFKCSICGKIVCPTVKIDSDGKVDIIKKSYEIISGNKVLKEKVCASCKSKTWAF